DVTGDVNIRKEIHFDALEPVPLAGFAAAPLHIKAEAARLIAALAGFGQHGVQVADQRKQAGVGGRVRAWGPADRRLIDADYLVDALDAANLIILAGVRPTTVNLPG